MSRRFTLLIFAALVALVGPYQLTPSQADEQEFNRSNCEVEDKCS